MDPIDPTQNEDNGKDLTLKRKSFNLTFVDVNYIMYVHIVRNRLYQGHNGHISGI